MSVLSNRPIKQTRPGGDKRDRDIVLASTPSFERRLEAARPVSLSLVLGRLRPRYRVVDVTIIIYGTITFRPVGWSVAPCLSCGQNEAMRREDKIETTWLWVFPISKEVLGRIARCDFCKRQQAVPPINPILAFGNWKPSDGMTCLVRRLGVDEIAEVPRPVNSTHHLNSLLSAITEDTALTSFEASRGAATGAVFGLVFGPPVGLALHWTGLLISLGGDALGVGLLGIIIGGIGGALVGASIQTFFGRRRLARERILAAVRDYGVDIKWLSELSRPFGGLVRGAVRSALRRGRNEAAAQQTDEA